MGIHALIIIPLFFHDELVGTISVVWLEREHVWLDGDTRLLRLVGEIIVNALQRRQSEESIRHFNERLEGMHAIDHAILSAQSAQAIAFSALGHLQKLVPYDTAEVEYINLESGETEMLASQVGEDIQSGEARVSSSGLLDLPPALLQGNNHLVNDVNEHTLAYEIEKSLQSQGAASFLIAPLIFHEEFTGVLILTAEESDVFSDDRLLVVCEVADMLALGIKNALLFDEARETVEREMRLDEVTRIISGTLDVDIILKEVVRLSLELVNADASCFCLLSSDLKSVASSYQKGLPPEFEQIYRPHEWEVTRLSLCDKQSMIINDYFNQKEAIDLLLEQGVRRMMCVPVQASGMQMGVLLMFRMGNAKKFNTRDLWIIETVGRQAGAAIQNAMFYQSERHRVQELEAMSDIVADTLGELDLTMLLEAVVVRSVALLDTTGGELGLYDEKTKEIRVLVSFGLDQDYTNTRLAEGQGVMGHVAASHMPLMVREYQKSEGYTDTYRGLKNSAVLAVPLVARKKLLGVLAVVDSFPGRVFGPEDMHLLNLFGQQAAIAMENAMLYRSAQQRAIEAETLQQVAAVVASKLNLNEAIPTILEQLGKVIPYDSASVKLIHDGQLETVGGMGFPDLQAIMNIRFPVNGDGPNARVLRSGEPLIINDYRLEYEKFGTPPHDSVRSWLGVAMVFQKRNIGMLTLNSNEVNHFDEEHARMASAFADQVAIAIENARLFEEIQRLATTDPLTELYNRRHFFELSRGELERACRYKRQLSVMMLDIDRFKRINDRYGHLMGDHVLCIIAQRIRSSLRDIDITGRYGGEEFVILLPETGTQEAQEAAERLRRNIADTSVEIGESSESITVSVGVVTLDRQEKSVEIEKLFDRADQALYHAKQKGRNRVVVWSDSIPQNGHISGV